MISVILIESLTGELIDDCTLDKVAEQVIETLKSELPVEAQTYDVLFYTLRKVKEKIKGSRLEL